MTRSACPVCRPYRLVDAPLDIPCPGCGCRMQLLQAPGLEDVYHCPAHCATLAPSSAMLAAARARRN
jgi:hypothetical protein